MNRFDLFVVRRGRAAALLLLLALAASAPAQSADPKSPTPLTAGEITGGEIEERAAYYFTFEGGPGEVTAELEAKIKKGTQGVGVEILDADSRSLAATILTGGLDAGREKIESELFKQLGKITSAADSLGGDGRRKTARVKVKTRQQLVLRLTVNKGVESFTLRVGGAVAFAPEAPFGGQSPYPTYEQAAPTPEPTPAAEQPAEQTVQTPPASGESQSEGAQPTGARPAVLRVPGRRPAVLRVPAKQATQTESQSQTQSQPQQSAPQPPTPQTQTQKPAPIRIPGKKRP